MISDFGLIFSFIISLFIYMFFKFRCKGNKFIWFFANIPS
nr:MAG TPA: Endothelial cell-specific chemotaxis regulator [Caudoviricetes sp.]